MEKELYSIKDISELTKIPAKSLREYHKQGILKGEKLNRDIICKASDVAEFIYGNWENNDSENSYDKNRTDIKRKRNRCYNKYLSESELYSNQTEEQIKKLYNLKNIYEKGKSEKPEDRLTIFDIIDKDEIYKISSRLPSLNQWGIPFFRENDRFKSYLFNEEKNIKLQYECSFEDAMRSMEIAEDSLIDLLTYCVQSELIIVNWEKFHEYTSKHKQDILKNCYYPPDYSKEKITIEEYFDNYPFTYIKCSINKVYEMSGEIFNILSDIRHYPLLYIKVIRVLFYILGKNCHKLFDIGKGMGSDYNNGRNHRKDSVFYQVIKKAINLNTIYKKKESKRSIGLNKNIKENVTLKNKIKSNLKSKTKGKHIDFFSYNESREYLEKLITIFDSIFEGRCYPEELEDPSQLELKPEFIAIDKPIYKLERSVLLQKTENKKIDIRRLKFIPNHITVKNVKRRNTIKCSWFMINNVIRKRIRCRNICRKSINKKEYNIRRNINEIGLRKIDRKLKFYHKVNKVYNLSKKQKRNIRKFKYISNNKTMRKRGKKFMKRFTK